MVSALASVNLPLHHKVQRFSSGTSSPGWSRKKGRKTVVVVVHRITRTIKQELLGISNDFKDNSALLIDII